MQSKVTHVLEDSDFTATKALLQTLAQLHILRKDATNTEYTASLDDIISAVKKEAHHLTLEAYKLGVKEANGR